MDVSFNYGKKEFIPSEINPGSLYFSLGNSNEIFLDYIEESKKKELHSL